MLIHTFPVGLLQCNCVILACEETHEALVFDPGDEVDRILEVLRENNLTLKGILHTHAHLDHIGATAPLSTATHAPIFLHRGELPLYDNVAMQADFLGIETPQTAPIDRYVRDGDALAWGRLEAEVLHTPGHTPGSVCFRVPGAGRHGVNAGSGLREVPDPSADPVAGPGLLLAGDTLFAGSIGRTDLWGGDYDQIMQSIRRRLMALPDETVVIPGHGPETSIGRERRTNPFLTGGGGVTR